MELSEILCIAMFATFILFLFTGYPVAWVLGGVAVLYAVIGIVMVNYFDAELWIDWGSSMGVVPERLWANISSDTLVALPMFIFMGLMLDRSGLAEELMNSLVKLFGKFRGGYAIVVTLIGLMLAATTGIVGASVVLLGVISIPVMLKNNYSKELAVGTACSVGTLGILIPPSIMLVIMADRLSDPAADTGDLFFGAMIPGLLLGAAYITYIFVFALVNPKAAPAPINAPPITKQVIWEVIQATFFPVMLIISVLGSIFAGFATTTEASGIGALGATWLFFYKTSFRNGGSIKLLFAIAAAGIVLLLVGQSLSGIEFTLKRFIVNILLGSITATLPYLAVKAMKQSDGLSTLSGTLFQTTKTTAFIFGIFLGATAFAIVLRGLGGDEVITEAINSLPFHDSGKVIFILAIVFFLGFFLDWIEITLIILPLVAPSIKEMGFDLVWFTIMFAVCLQTSFLTPPVGFSLFYIKGVCPPEIKVSHIYRGVIPFIIIQLTVLSSIFYWEEIVTWLPQYVEAKQLTALNSK